MTATIDPGDYAHQVVRSDVQLRTGDYIEALRFWAAFPDPRIAGVVFCENSGNDLALIQAESVNFPSGRPLEVLGFRGNTKPLGMHYGYSELGLIDYAFEHSQLLQNSPYFAKVTGRCRFPDISFLIDSLDQDIFAAVDHRRAYRSEGGVRLRSRTQLMIFARDFYRDTLLHSRERMVNNCSHIEEFLPQLLLPIHHSEPKRVCMRWSVEVTAWGVGAHNGKLYASTKERLKAVTRALCRRWVPSVWL